MRHRTYISTLQDLPGPVRPGRGTAIGALTTLPVPFAARLGPGGVLSWQWVSEPKQPQASSITTRTSAHRPRKVDARLWKQFAGLAEASDEMIRRFAERWGPLRREPLRRGQAGTETVHEWRKLAGVATAVIRCAADPAQQRPGAPEDWKALCVWLRQPVDPHEFSKGGETAAMLRRYVLAAALNHWYAQSSGNRLVSVEEDKLLIRPSVTSLLGIIGLQLATQVTGVSQMLQCYHCHRFFSPPRKPPTGARTFCPRCRSQARPVMYAMRDYRRRRSEK